MKRDWKLFKHYDDYRRVGEQVLRRTSTGEAPWVIVEGADRRYRNLTVARALFETLRLRLEQGRSGPPVTDAQPVHLVPPAVNVISRLDLGLTLDAGPYKGELQRAQG